MNENEIYKLAGILAKRHGGKTMLKAVVDRQVFLIKCLLHKFTFKQISKFVMENEWVRTLERFEEMYEQQKEIKKQRKLEREERRKKMVKKRYTEEELQTVWYGAMKI